VYSATASHIVVIQGHRIREEDMLIGYDIYIDNIKKKSSLSISFKAVGKK